MPGNEEQLPESQLERAQWLADNLALCGYEDLTAIDILAGQCGAEACA
jgi:hypothetical protein